MSVAVVGIGSFSLTKHQIQTRQQHDQDNEDEQAVAGGDEEVIGVIEFFQQAPLKFGFVLSFVLIAPGDSDTIWREDQLVDREEQHHAEGDDENSVVFSRSQQRKGHVPTLWGWHCVGNRNNRPVDNAEPLPLPDAHYWEAAQGWTGLRNAKEAYAELEKIRPELQEHPFVRSAWLDAWILGDEWAKAREMATCLTNEFPDEPGFWLHLAYATRRAEGAGMEQALEVLDGALEGFPKEWMIPYNMACYLCQLERLDEAKSRLAKALEIGGKGIRTAALGDEDLLPLWPWIKKREE